MLHDFVLTRDVPTMIPIMGMGPISPHTHPYKMSTDSTTLTPLCGSGLEQLTAGSTGLFFKGIWTWFFKNLTKRSRNLKNDGLDD